MTHIADYPTKKAFKEAVEATEGDVWVDDPSIFNPVSGFVKDVVAEHRSIVVTNHPKRSWFAEVSLKNGEIKVS